jgi:ParB family transcriptional regulator, chromosome partitioning protein
MKPWKFVIILLRGYLIMSKKKRFGVSQALSRGLSETINVVENNTNMYRSAVLPISRIELDPENPRKLTINLNDVRLGIEAADPQYHKKAAELEKLQEMATTITSSGVINPIVVYKRGELYRVVAGERRCLASILAGKNEIEARIFNDKPQGYELKLVQWIENTAREDLNLYERIGNISEIIREYIQQNPTEVANATLLKKITGLSLSQASFYMTVLSAPVDIQAAIEEGKIRNLDKAALIATVTPATARKEIIIACAAGSSLKDLKALITKQKASLSTATASIAKPKRGRALTRINMGHTSQTSVIQQIVDAVVSQPQLAKYAMQFAKVDWNDIEQTAAAFRKLISILERETVRASQ